MIGVATIGLTRTSFVRANLHFELLKWQQSLLQDKTRFQVVVAGRRCGKTRFAAVKLIVEALKCRDTLARVEVSREIRVASFEDRDSRAGIMAVSSRPRTENCRWRRR